MANQQDITTPKMFLGAYVTRSSTNFGLNNTPTTLDLDLVEGSPNNPEDVSYNATGFQYIQAIPGTQHRFTYGALDFIGIVQTWTENWGPQGKTFSVKLTDPRIAFNNVWINLNSISVVPTGQFLWNYFNPIGYYGAPALADINEEGASFHKTKNYIEAATGVINLYNNRYFLQFTTGYAPTSGINLGPTGIPLWYRIQGTQTSLDQFINQSSNDMGMDWYAYVDPTTYVQGARNKIVVQHVPRLITSGVDIINIISGCTETGTLISYRRGQELRTDALMIALGGAEHTYWRGLNVSEVAHYWGRMPDGSAMTTANNITSGLVVLDHIRGTGTSVLAPFTLSLTKTVVTRTSAANVYPPTIARSTTSQTVTGYSPTYQTMRAALYSQNAWETVLYYEHNNLATAIGITNPGFLDGITYVTNYNSLERAQRLSIFGNGITNRTEVQKQLANAIYEATRAQAETYWGKSWFVNLPDSNWLQNGTYNHTDITPTIEYSVADAAWSESTVAMPSGVSNHELLNATNSATFKDNLGRLKAFCSLVNFGRYYDATNNYPVGFPYYLDFTEVDPSLMLIEQGPKLCVPIEVEQYDLNPTKAIVTLPFALKAKMAKEGYENRAAFYDFLKYMGYTDGAIVTGNLIQTYGDNSDYGLAPPRVVNLDTVNNTHGIFIPLKSNVATFGYTAVTGNTAGPLSIINDSSLAPWTYGNYANMYLASSGLAGRSLSTSYLLDYGDLTLAGLPIFNIGANIGVNAIIGGISTQLGREGLITNYSIKTIAVPLAKINKLLSDRINGIYLDNQRNHRDIVKIKDILTDSPVYNQNTLDDANRFSQTSNNGFMVGFI